MTYCSHVYLLVLTFLSFHHLFFYFYLGVSLLVILMKDGLSELGWDELFILAVIVLSKSIFLVLVDLLKLVLEGGVNNCIFPFSNHTDVN